MISLNAPGNVLGGWLVQRRISCWILLTVCLTLMGVMGLALFSTAAADAVKLAVALAFSFIGSVIPGAILASAPVHAPQQESLGAVNGIIVQGSNLGNLVGPPAVGAVVIITGGWTGPGWLVLAAASVGVILALALRRVERRL